MADERPAWRNSNRSKRLPADWYTPGGIRDQVLNDPKNPNSRKCHIRIPDVCIGFATQVDHIVAGDNHDRSNLQPACKPCHQIKSSREGAAARPRLHRPKPVHPAFR